MSKQKIDVISHPLISHHLSIIKNKNTKSDDFRRSAKEISRILMVEAANNLPTTHIEVETPLAKQELKVPDPNVPIYVAPILRAALTMGEVAAEILPNVIIQHLGMYRDEKTLKPVWYFNKLPETIPMADRAMVYICDPMLATGNSASEAIKLFLKAGALEKNITFVCLVSAPEGVKHLRDDFPEIRIITAALDEKLNDKGYIVPGLGDAGDRMFNTVK